MKKEFMECVELVLDAKINGVKGLSIDIDTSGGITFYHRDAFTHNPKKNFHSYSGDLSDLNDDYNTPLIELPKKINEYLNSIKETV